MGGCREQRDEKNLPREKVQPEESYSPAHSFLHPPHNGARTEGWDLTPDDLVQEGRGS